MHIVDYKMMIRYQKIVSILLRQINKENVFLIITPKCFYNNHYKLVVENFLQQTIKI